MQLTYLVGRVLKQLVGGTVGGPDLALLVYGDDGISDAVEDCARSPEQGLVQACRFHLDRFVHRGTANFAASRRCLAQVRPLCTVPVCFPIGHSTHSGTRVRWIP